ncbi:MAG: cyclic nucleotide-binding protein [Ignavibacteria bacterium GWA2_55_11]|nr:MAG: cyclic nucleotide-binding protein [Ignavibacteria bacterium GWA2_55_11]
MSELLRKHIDKRVRLTGEEFRMCSGFFVPKRVKKRQFLLQEGDVCKQLAFVTAGCLREYSIDHKGEEHIIQFAVEDWWISDLNSFLTGTASTHNIDALENSEVLLLDKAARDKMLETIPKMERFFRIILENNYIATHRRINEALSATAEERYLAFLKTYPVQAEKLPQNQIASFLGITPQSLSRIRKEMSRKR